MKRKAKHAALQELANMMLPSLMEDVDTSEMMKSMPKEVKQVVEQREEPKKKKKPAKEVFSLTRLMSDTEIVTPKGAPPKKKGFLKKSKK